MPKNKGKGGKNRRRGKNEGEEKRELIKKEEFQDYAKVTRMLGQGRLEAFCVSDGKTRQCHIRGKMRKKVWVQAGDIVLISLREYQDDKADVILKYTSEEARALKTAGELPDTINVNDIADGAPDGEEGFEFDNAGDSDDDSESSEDDARPAPRSAGGAGAGAAAPAAASAATSASADTTTTTSGAAATTTTTADSDDEEEEEGAAGASGSGAGVVVPGVYDPSKLREAAASGKVKDKRFKGLSGREKERRTGGAGGGWSRGGGGGRMADADIDAI